jgi:hypothetical protein
MKKDLFDDKMMEKIFKDIEKDVTGSKKAIFEKNKKMLCGTLANNKKVSDDDLIVTMSKRMTGLEKQLADTMVTMDRLKSENEKLKKEIVSNADGCGKCTVYEKHIQELDKYIDELNEFIKDNGFVVMKAKPELDRLDDEECKSRNEAILKELESKIQNLAPHSDSSGESDHNEDIEKLLPKEIDINVLTRRVEEMNMLFLKDGENTKFEMDSDKIFRLKHLRKEITFYLYKNGLAVEGYKFYDYKTLEAKKILRDILDGYSPFILRKQYPDGVIIKLENKIHMDYKEGSLTGVASLNQPKVKNKLSAEEFLNSLPDKVVKNGKVFHIRDEIEKHLVVKRSTDHYSTENDEYFLIDKEKTLPDDICKLKIQILIIDKVITVNINKSEHFLKLFDFLKKFINSNIHVQFGKIKDIQNYVLYQTYPFKSYEYVDTKNFFENGLFPASFLIFEERSKIKK